MNRIGQAILIATAFGCAASAHAASEHGRSRSVGAAAVDNTAFIGVNNLQMVVSNVGSFAYDPSQHFGKTDGLYFPRGTNRTVIFASGLWVGAMVNGAPRVAISEFSSEFGPGIMDDGTYAPDVGRFHVYTINRGDDAETNPDYAAWPFDDGAPSLTGADGSDSLDADGNRIPLVLGDQSLWAVYNDANQAKHNNGAGSTQPLGIEVRQHTFAYARSGAIGQTIYLTFEIINKGSNLLEDTYLSIWCDPDVGDAFDDLVGCDTTLSLGYAYNEGPDGVYGDAVPAVGFDFLQGPIVPSPGDQAHWLGRTIADHRNLPMSSFNKYVNGTDPQSSTETYNYMKGLEPDGTPLVDPEGDTTFFQLAGDPVSGNGWIDVNSNDRRFMMSSGPFTMTPGDTQQVVVAVLVGQGADHLSSITALRDIDEQVQAVFDLNFAIPFPPPQPKVWAQPLSGSIELIWDHEAEGDIQESEILGQRFVMEGYNVYQGRSITGPWTRIATFDVVNDIGRIYADRFDPTVGAIQRVLVQSGSNSGIENLLTISQDRLTGKSLINHKPYFFAVTAYSYDELNVEEFMAGSNLVGHLTEDLETRLDGIELIPNSVALDLVENADHVSGVSDGSALVRTVDPDALVTGQYRVSFNEDSTWNLDNLTTDTRYLEGQTDKSGAPGYSVVAGLMVQVSDPHAGVKDVGWSGSEEPWVGGVNWGGYYYGGALDAGAYFFGSSILDEAELRTVELRFSPTQTQRGYRYLRNGTPNYGYGGYTTVPLTAWDVTIDPPRQLNVCFVEDAALASNDETWLPPDDDPLGGREYLFILNSDYSDEPDEYYTARNILADGFDFDVLYAWWPAVNEGHSNEELADGQLLTISVFRFNAPDDQFEFSITAAGDEGATNNASLAQVHPVPNPYVHGLNTATGEPISGIKFVNLPASAATVEIYNLVGERIASVEKNDLAASWVLWDVRTLHGLPPASGLYVYRIIVPGVGERVGRVALFTGEERLQQY